MSSRDAERLEYLLDSLPRGAFTAKEDLEAEVARRWENHLVVNGRCDGARPGLTAPLCGGLLVASRERQPGLPSTRGVTSIGA
ncbi:MAG: hypothetical protein GVY09_19350 [Gammaproteobacteria bacterium]|nr:hypothetical protein [Gammaproteobacteria bacterium]